LSTDQIEAFIRGPGSKSRRLLKAYQCALDPSKWERDGSKPIESEADGDDGDEAKESSNDKKRKRDSEPLVNAGLAEGNIPKCSAVSNPKDDWNPLNADEGDKNAGRSTQTPEPATQKPQPHDYDDSVPICSSCLHPCHATDI
jgi:hypothetical protein